MSSVEPGYRCLLMLIHFESFGVTTLTHPTENRAVYSKFRAQQGAAGIKQDSDQSSKATS